MKKEYIFVMFALCFFVWAIVVDNLVVPRMDKLQSDTGIFSRYRLKEWTGDKKLDLINDELLVYAYVTQHGRQHERLYYFDRAPHFETILKGIQPGEAIELRYAKAFPKIWKKKLYDVRMNGVSMIRYSPIQLAQRQKFIWKFTAVMVGAFAVLTVLGFVNKPRQK